MHNKDEYEKNINKMATIYNKDEAYFFPAPKHKAFIDILKQMYDEADAAIAANMDVFPAVEDIETIANRAHMNKDEVLKGLDKLIDKGMVFRAEESGTYKYCLWAADPGLFTTALCKGEDNEETRKFAENWNKFYTEGFGKNVRSVDSPIMRVLPIEEEVPSEQVVLSYEKVSGVLDAVSYYALLHCTCKVVKKLIGETCKHGPETEICLFFGEFGKFFVDTGYAREITRAEAEDIIMRAQEKGLVHMTVNQKKDCVGLCSCCTCCCIHLESLWRFEDTKGRQSYAPSMFFAVVDRKVCDGCENSTAPVCIGKCPMNAISLKDGKALVNAKKCIGCGICSYSCPVGGAISLIRKAKEEEPFEDFPSLAQRVIGARKSH